MSHMNRNIIYTIISLAIAIGSTLFSTVPTAYAGDDSQDLTSMSLEDLLNIPVTSVAKRQQTVKTSAAAVFVITQEDIRRSTAQSIPELLRMVPGLHVARLDGSRYAITSRGLNGIFANKLLVLIDGRTVYTPIFSGVYWDAQDTLLEDIDRIEVIRGPGAALWGSNAVNGVINIMTKKSADTQGGKFEAGGGKNEQGFGGARYGFQIGDATTARVYGKVRSTDNLAREGGGDNYDGMLQRQGGFRADSNFDASILTVQGDIYDSREKEETAFPSLNGPPLNLTRQNADLSGANLLARFTRANEDGSEFQTQLYFDRADRDSAVILSHITTFDFDSQYRTHLNEINEITFGLGFRNVSDELYGRNGLVFDPHARELNTASSFIQDVVDIVPNAVKLTLGAKFEHNEFVGAEWQPNAHLIWTPSQKHSIWGSISRAAKTPSRAEEDLRLPLAVIPGQLPTYVSVAGDHSLKSEELLAYEIGYRYEPLPSLSFDIATFYNHFNDVVTLENETPQVVVGDNGPFVQAPISFRNLGKQNIYGAEFVSTWQALESVRLQGWYTYLETDSSVTSSSTDTNLAKIGGQNPHTQAALRTLIQLSDTVELDSMARYVGACPSFGVDDYFELSSRVGWKLSKDLEISVVGTDILSPSHDEYATQYVNITRSRVNRGIFGLIRYSF